MRMLLNVIVPYSVMFIASYSATRLLTKDNPRIYLYTPRREKPGKKKKIGVMDLILVIELFAIVIYTAVDFWIFYRVGAEPSTLTMSFFAVCGGENGMMAWIKTRKEQERTRRLGMEEEGKEYTEDDGL